MKHHLTNHPIRRFTKLLAALAGSGMLCGGTLFAATAYVDKANASDPLMDGTAAHPYATIQAAINDIFIGATEVVIYPGLYQENILVTKNIKLRGNDGPHTTKIDGSLRVSRQDTITSNPGLDIWIEGLGITGGRYGIYQPSTGTLHVRNCVVCGNTSHGILIDRYDPNNTPTAYIYNCVLVYNDGSGCYCQGTTTGHTFYYWPVVTIYNTILTANKGYGIGTNMGGVDSGSSVITHNYNDCFGNVAGKYHSLLDSGGIFPPGAQSTSTACSFVGGAGAVCNKDFRLVPGANPCIDTGLPGDGWLDPDGTRNDMGAYGGPAAQNFYTNPNDGPFIRNLTIRQGMIPKGSTFTIEATGATR